MSSIAIAFYKGPPNDDWVHALSHYGIRVWTWSRWSHAELVIDGWCWSASGRDHGVRRKRIDLESGRWDVVHLDLDQEAIARALAWFLLHEGESYDYRNILRFMIPAVGHNKRHWVCFESIGEALGLAGTHRLTANDLWRWANERRVDEPGLAFSSAD